MQIIKPLRLGIMTNPIPDRPRSHLAITSLVCFDLLNPETILTEQAMWNAITPLLGEQGALDAWTPKQHGEVLLWGDAVAPGGESVQQMKVSIAVGDSVRKTLVVKGDRHWLPTLMSAKSSEPLPFVSMPLTPERSFGGQDFALNPVGAGHNAMLRLDKGDLVALPNIEYPENPILHPSQEPQPAGLMPVNMNWPLYGPGGTYDDGWRKHRFPARPSDFNWQAYNVAPRDQRIPGFFHGTEAIELTGLHPQHPQINAYVPALTLRSFIRRKDSEALEESPAVLDTLCLFPSALCGVLIYRSQVELHHGDDLQHIGAIMLACEHIAAPRSREHYEEVFSLRTGEDRGLYALSDYQLMPPFSAVDKLRLEARREEVQQEQAATRIKKDAWFAAYAAAAVDVTLPDGFFSHAEDADPDTLPIITDLDHELGNVDMAGLKSAADKLRDRMLAKADVLQKDADIQLAKAQSQAEAIREYSRSGDAAPLLAKFAEEGPREKNEAIDAEVASMRSIADRVDADPAWSLAQASQALSKPHQAKAIAQALKLEDKLSAFDKAELLKAKDALEQADDMSFAHDDPPEARLQFADNLRQIAAGLAGDAVPPRSPDAPETMASSADQFLQSMKISGAAHGAKPDAGAILKSLGNTFRNLPPDQAGDAAVAALSGLPGTAGIDFSEIKAGLDLTAQEQPDLMRQIGEGFTNPPDGNTLRQQMATSFDAMPPDANVAQRLSAVAPQFVKGDKVDWEDFLTQMGVGDIPPLPASFTETTPDETPEAQALRRANALALGQPGVYRLGPDLPAETPEEIQGNQLREEFFAQQVDPEEAARSNAFTSQFLQASQDARQREGSLNAAARSSVTDQMIDHALAQPAAAPDLVKSKGSMGQTLALAYTASTMGSSILRQVLPESEKMHRDARQSAPVPLIERAELPPAIALAVGALVRQEAARNVSLAGRDLAGADLRGAQLAGLDLTGAFLEHANLTGANLTGALCDGAVFSGACLDGAKFNGASLKKANFAEAQAIGTDFSDAQLDDAMLHKANFSRADLSRANLGECNALHALFTDACLDGSNCQEGLFIEADLSRATLHGAIWYKAQFVQAKLNGLQAREADLRECLFADVEADGCDFSGADLRGVIAVKSSFKGLLAAGVQATGSGWAQSELGGADFSRAQLAQVGFMDAKLDGVDFTHANLRRAMLLNASLRDSYLDGAQMYEASLRGADLTNASLRHANLHTVDLGNATLELSDMTGARLLQTHLEMPSANPQN
jgi:uncharacterized protein YjbI with pentapeptide repeats